MSSQVLHSVRTVQHFTWQALFSESPPELRGGNSVREAGERWLEREALRSESIDVAVRGERKYPEAIGMARNDVKRARADTAGGTKDRDALHRIHVPEDSK